MIRDTRRLVAAFVACLAFAAAFFSVFLHPAFAADSNPPSLRLGDAVRPLAYHLDLTLVPTAPGYDGHIEIDVELRQAQDHFWMNATSLQVRRAVLTVAGKPFEANVAVAGEDIIGLQFAETIPAGKARLAIDYSGNFSTNETRGLFKQQDGGEWYAFSQFEALNARRAFPCFDEPHWKTPWTVSLTVRREHVAVSNTEAVGEDDAGNGMKRVRFATTLPLPTYLVAFGVGPFDVVDGGTGGRNKVAMRYIVPKGRAVEARYAKEVTPALLALLEDYFGRPYPFSKLDSMVIPVTVAFGAMENPGLITYRSSILLSRPEREDERFQQRYASIAAHEMAHQWFGDLVTMTWWDDLWLNESFATWMARKIVQQFNPQWAAHDRSEHERQQAIETDRLATTRRIRQAIETKDDVINAFDGITYDKGGAVLTMFESWLGESGFRDGVRRYLNKHEFGNAGAEDFFEALAGTDQTLAKAFSSFVEQPGVPHIALELACKGKPSLRLKQERFQPAALRAGNEQRWIVPVCVRYPTSASAGGNTGKPFCTLLQEKTAAVPLPDVSSCPAWLLPNPGGAGYFLSSLGGAQAAKLRKAPLKATEVQSLLGDLSALAAAGDFPMDSLLQLAAAFAADSRPEAAKAAADAVWKVHPAMLDQQGRQRLAQWVRTHFGKRASELGWLPRDADSDAVRKLRTTLLPLVAEVGEDVVLRSQARELAREAVHGTGPKPGAMFGPILKSAARSGDEALFDAFAEAAAHQRDSNARNEIYKALGSFREDALRQRAFALVLSNRYDAREASEIMWSAGHNPENAPALQQFLYQKYDSIAAVLPEETLAKLPSWGREMCSAPERAQFESFYKDRAAKVPGGARNFAQALESIDICVRSRQVQARRLQRFLHVQG